MVMLTEIQLFHVHLNFIAAVIQTHTVWNGSVQDLKDMSWHN
jgi:hypothetical protein